MLFQQQQENTKTLMTLMTREPPVDPVRDALLTKAINGGDEAGQKAAALIAQMGGFMSQMTGMTVQLLHTQAELNQPGPVESPMWGIAGKLIDGYFTSVAEQSDELTETLAPEADKAALAAGEEQGEQEEGAEQEEATEEPSVENPLQRLDRAIHQEAPLKELADALCMALVTDDFKALYVKAKGDLRALISGRYGAWAGSTDVKDPTERKATIARRVKYLSTMLPKAWKVAEQRGIIRAPPATATKAATPAAQHSRAQAKKRTAAAPPPSPAPDAGLSAVEPEASP